MKRPSPNGDNGRASNGRFTKNNAGGPGNPFARRVAKLRTVLLDAVTEDDLRDIVRAMVERAKNGDMAAAREILARLVGKPSNGPNPDRLDFDEQYAEIAAHQVASYARADCSHSAANPT